MNEWFVNFVFVDGEFCYVVTSLLMMFSFSIFNVKHWSFLFSYLYFDYGTFVPFEIMFLRSKIVLND